MSSIGVILILLAGALMWFDRHAIWDCLRSRRWVRVAASVIDSDTVSFSIDTCDEFHGSFVRTYSHCEWVYKYEWDGKEYFGNKYCFGWHFDQPHGGLPVGHQFNVFCNPKCPSESVVKPGLAFATYWSLSILGCGVVLLGLTWMHNSGAI